MLSTAGIKMVRLKLHEVTGLFSNVKSNFVVWFMNIVGGEL